MNYFHLPLSFPLANVVIYGARRNCKDRVPGHPLWQDRGRSPTSPPFLCRGAGCQARAEVGQAPVAELCCWVFAVLGHAQARAALPLCPLSSTKTSGLGVLGVNTWAAALWGLFMGAVPESGGARGCRGPGTVEAHDLPAAGDLSFWVLRLCPTDWQGGEDTLYPCVTWRGRGKAPSVTRTHLLLQGLQDPQNPFLSAPPAWHLGWAPLPAGGLPCPCTRVAPLWCPSDPGRDAICPAMGEADLHFGNPDLLLR